MIVKWIVPGTFYGKPKSFFTSIPELELEKCKSPHETQKLIHQFIQKDFEQEVGWSLVSTSNDTDLSIEEQEEYQGIQQ